MTKIAKRISLWTLAVLIIISSVLIMIKVVSPGLAILQNDQITESDWTQGNSDSKITIIEYSDFQCPACAYYSQITSDLVDEFGKHILFAYRHFPLKTIHNGAVISAQAAEAAGLQNKFWEMHDMLFENQSTWAGKSESELEEIFIGYATSLGLDISQFVEDLNGSIAQDEVEQDYQSAMESGLNSTPTFFINGVQIKNPRTYEDFRSVIIQEIEKAS